MHLGRSRSLTYSTPNFSTAEQKLSEDDLDLQMPTVLEVKAFHRKAMRVMTGCIKPTPVNLPTLPKDQLDTLSSVPPQLYIAYNLIQDILNFSHHPPANWLPTHAWVQLSRLRTGFERFATTMKKWHLLTQHNSHAAENSLLNTF